MSPAEIAAMKRLASHGIWEGETPYIEIADALESLIAEVERLNNALKLERQAHLLTFDLSMKKHLEKSEKNNLTGWNKIATESDQ